MKWFVAQILLAATGVLCTSTLAPGVPRSIAEFRAKHPPQKRDDPPRRRIITIQPSANLTDDVSDAFLRAMHDANHGGTLHLPAGERFVIGQPLDLTFLDNIDIRLDGEILFTDDTAHWQARAFRHPFQNSIMFWKWGGRDIRIFGDGALNGNGQRWWNEFAGKEILDSGNTYLRPILFYAENATGIAIEGIHLKDSPCWTTFFVSSKDISLTDVVCTARSTNATSPPKNTDFFDSLNVERVRVERAWVDIGDDCFSPKSNASDIHVRTMYCNGTHGQSMGSIGQYAGEMSFIRDVVIEDVWMLNGQHAARLKAWAGADAGYGFVDNVTFRNFWNANNEYTAFLDSCYFNIDASTCASHPSRVNMTNIVFENFSGSTSGKYGRAVGRLTCSPNAVCSGIHFRNFTVTSPCGGPAVILCDGIHETGISGVSCVSSTSSQGKAALKQKCTAARASLPKPTPW
ncbi:pectin lyase fold/virulence factor [Echria macrotheca]|uniref:galacturonan 1,4-alpha-galacturonidase n=1 Tax=Echria macrotheca TaxID=438768 RepID=A0AAJ0B627_9PEZI|nr:pectin lyase fold/virulence factor [Echria macrotheca]